MKKNKYILLSFLLSISLLSSCKPKNNVDGIQWFYGENTPGYNINAINGDLYFNTENGKIYLFTNKQWKYLITIANVDANSTLSPYELFLLSNPEYSKSESEWINDLVSNKLPVIDTYTVTFNANNGTENFTKEISENQKIDIPTTPTNGNYVFKGWYNQYDEPWLFNQYTVTENITLTAKWDLDESQPSFDTITIDEAITLTKALSAGSKSSESYYIKGTISSVWNENYGNLYLSSSSADVFTIYGTLSSDGSVSYSNMAIQLEVGDEVIFYGKLYHFVDSKNVHKYEIEDAWLMSVDNKLVSSDGDFENSNSGGSTDNNPGGSTDNNPGGSTGGDIITPVNPGTQWTNTDFGNYYQTIDFSNNNTLLSQLQSLNKTKRTRTVGYGNMWSYFNQTDYDPSNPSKYLAFYKGTGASKGEMNKEHVWPNSHGGDTVEADIHVIRPTLSKDNSSRGNSYYVEGMNHSANGWDPKTAGMNEQYRGQAARIIFYCVVANPSLSIVDNTKSSTPDMKMGKLSDLLKWNLQYAVHQTELNRNEGAQNIQGNRNPFIDNPYLACAIWGNTNATTREICKDYGVIVDPYTGDIEIPGGNTGGDLSTPDVSVPDSSTPSTPLNGYFTKVESQSDLEVGAQYLIVCESKNVAAGSFSSKYLKEVSITISNNMITSKPESAQVFILGGSSGAYTLAIENGDTLACSSVKTLLYSNTNNTWKITISSGIATITPSSGSKGDLKYNSQSPRFTTYQSTDIMINAISLYKFVSA